MILFIIILFYFFVRMKKEWLVDLRKEKKEFEEADHQKQRDKIVQAWMRAIVSFFLADDGGLQDVVE